MNSESHSKELTLGIILSRAAKMADVPMVCEAGSKASSAANKLEGELLCVLLNISTEVIRKTCRSNPEVLCGGPDWGVNARAEFRKASRVVGAFRAAADEEEEDMMMMRLLL